MLSPFDALRGVIPNCKCGATYDLRFCAPHILPCAHTFCLMCLSKDDQRKKRRCPLCQKKYSSFILNVILAEIVERVRQRREWMEGRSRRCDECESRLPLTMMRRCLSCVRDIGKHVAIGCTLDCVICLECCVNHHNGHEFIAIGPASSCSPTSVPPIASSTPRSSTPRYVSWKASKYKEKTPRKTTIKSQSLSHITKVGRSQVSLTTEAVEDELVFETRSPLYYHLTSSFSEVISNKSRIVQRLSGIIQTIFNPRLSAANRKDSRSRHSVSIRKASDASCRSGIDRDSSIYQSISPSSQNLSRMAYLPGFGLNDVERLPHHYINLSSRRCSN